MISANIDQRKMAASELSSASVPSLFSDFDSSSESNLLVENEDLKEEPEPTFLVIDSSKFGVLKRSLKWGGLKKVCI